MNRADRKKKAFKEKIKNIQKEYRGVIWAVALIALVVAVGTILNAIRTSKDSEWDIENIVDVDYTAEVVGEGTEAFVVLHGDLEDEDLVLIQDDVSAHYGTFLPIYVMDDGITLSAPVEFYQPGLLKRVDYLEKEKTTDIVRFEVYTNVEPDAGITEHWETYPEKSYINDYNDIVVPTSITSDLSSMEIAQFYNGMGEMMNKMNEDNEKASHENILFEIVQDDKYLYYHTAFEEILGHVTKFKTNRMN